MVQTRFTLFALATLFLSANACYEQCGGQGFTGSTTCTGGCVCVASSQYYSQCIPGTSSSTTAIKSSTTTTKASTTTTKASTTTTKAPTSTTTTKASTTSAAGAGPTPKFWFSFGDSYTQTQFNVNSTLPNPSNVFGNPVYPGYTACGSVTNWIDQMIVKYNHTYLYSYNFAYGGATIDASLVTPYLPTVLSMTDQVREFTNQVGSSSASTPWTSANSIFSFFIGINDVGNSYGSGSNTTNTQFCNTLMTAYFAQVQKVYNAGGRNFLFINVPPVDRSPLTLQQSAQSQATEKFMINTYNSDLVAKVAAFQAANTGTKTWIYDSNTRLNQILNSPSTYGFSDATSYGGATSAWCNNLHVSPGVHEYFAKDISSLLSTSGF